MLFFFTLYHHIFQKRDLKETMAEFEKSNFENSSVKGLEFFYQV